MYVIGGGRGKAERGSRYTIWLPHGQSYYTVSDISLKRNMPISLQRCRTMSGNTSPRDACS